MDSILQNLLLYITIVCNDTLVLPLFRCQASIYRWSATLTTVTAHRSCSHTTPHTSHRSSPCNRRRLQILYYQVSAQPPSQLLSHQDLFVKMMKLQLCTPPMVNVLFLSTVSHNWSTTDSCVLCASHVMVDSMLQLLLLIHVDACRTAIDGWLNVTVAITNSCVSYTSQLMVDSMLQLLFHSSIPTLSCYTSILWWTRVLLSSGVETKMTWKRCVVVSSCLCNIRLLPGWLIR